MTKPRALMFVSQFGQAGAERMAFEIDRAFDRSVMDLDILCRFPLTGRGGWEDYYYEHHVQNGTRVEFVKAPRLGRFGASIRYRLFPQFLKDATALDRPLSRYLEGYDVVLWMGEYLYNGLGPTLPESILSKSLIYVMSSKAQTFPEDYYSNFEKSKHYRFVSFLEFEDAIRSELDAFPDYEHHYFPLSFQLPGRPNTWQFKSDKKTKRIGIFTRLSRLKPIDPFLYALHLLLDRVPHVELDIFGSGDPYEEGIMRFINNLHLEGKVVFKGHVEDISKAALDAELDLIWFQSMHGMPGGFAGYDLCLTGIPQLYWEIASTNFTPRSEYPSFYNLNDFVDRSVAMLTDREAAEEQSRAQFDVTEKERDVSRNIGKLQALMLGVARGENVSGEI